MIIIIIKICGQQEHSPAFTARQHNAGAGKCNSQEKLSDCRIRNLRQVL